MNSRKIEPDSQSRPKLRYELSILLCWINNKSIGEKQYLGDISINSPCYVTRVSCCNNNTDIQLDILAKLS